MIIKILFRFKYKKIHPLRLTWSFIRVQRKQIQDDKYEIQKTNDNNVTYEDINVAENAEKRQEMIEMTGQMGVPVIRVGDDVVIGLDEAKVKELLGM